MLEQKDDEKSSNIALTNIDTFEMARRAHERYLLHSQHEDLNEALEYYIQTIKKEPNLPETYYRLASLLFEDGQIGVETAIEQCKTAVEMDPKNYNARLYAGYFLKSAHYF